MAFPTVAGFGGTNSAGNVTTTTVDVAARAGSPAAGDLVIILISKDGTGTFTWPATPAFTSLMVGTAYTSGLFEARYRVWQAGDSTSVAITHASEATAHQVYRITTGTWSAGVPVAGVAATNAGAANPDPPSLNPAGWDVEDTLWIAFCANDGDVAVTAGPSTPGTWSNFQNDRSTGATGQGIASARSNNASGTVDPGVFTMASEQWGAETIAIRQAQILIASGGTFAWSGSNATLIAPYRLTAGSGAYAETGTAATLKGKSVV